MKRIIIIISIITISTFLLGIAIKIFIPSMKAVVIEPNEKYLMVMDLDEGLYSISIPSNSKQQFKQGQEILVYYGGFVNQSYPAQINEVKKIIILKEQSKVEIPRNILRWVYTSSDNIDIAINEISQTGITITRKDTNKYKDEYKHSNYYSVSIKKENGGYSELTKKSTTKVEAKKINDDTIKTTYNWEKIYGKLEDKEYKFETKIADSYIVVYFSIDIKIGEIKYKVIETFFPF